MNTKKAGAIIRIIFYILRHDGRENQDFDSSDIFLSYKNLLKDPCHEDKIKEIIKKFKKRRDKMEIKTLQKEASLRGWLNKHVDGKEIFWFERLNGRFRIKPELLKTLDVMV